jgi:cyclic di-GMP phosphodiesterase
MSPVAPVPPVPREERVVSVVRSQAPPALTGPATILIAEADESDRLFYTQLFRAEGYAVDVAFDGSSALASVSSRPPDVLIIAVDLPGHDGFEVCRRIKQNSTTRLTPIILLTAIDHRARRLAGFDIGADEVLLKPVDTQELLVRARALVRMKRYTDDLDSASAILMTLATMIEWRDGDAAGHCTRMANYATSLGRELGVSDADIQVLDRGGYLHDVGMLAISDFVLRKRGPLTQEEYEQVKSHTVLGDELCANLRSLQPIRPLIRWHHERLDGSGYPDGLQGDQIPILAQIVGVVDVFEAVTTDRPYQRVRSPESAVEILRSDVERGWRRREIVEAFVSLMVGS